MIIAVDDDYVCGCIDDVFETIEGSRIKALVAGTREGYLDFSRMMEEASDDFARPAGEDASRLADDIMLCYFTSGTTGMPSMVAHNFIYPLGHILTAKFWQDLRERTCHLTARRHRLGKKGELGQALRPVDLRRGGLCLRLRHALPSDRLFKA